jgi:hypothetical protein
MIRRIVFALLVFVAGIVSAVFHEFGHCVFYWLQGIPAGMSLVKEYPLRDITAGEYAIGCVGGPLASLVLLTASLWLLARPAHGPRGKDVLSALVLANVFYFVLRGLISVLKRWGGELGDIAGLVGLDYRAVVVLYSVIVVCAIFHYVKATGVRVNLSTAGSFVALLVGYVFVMVAVESVDSSLLWKRFPAIQIDDGRTYNPRH